MNLSLRIKKFLNSEHTGDFVEITLPPVETYHREPKPRKRPLRERPAAAPHEDPLGPDVPSVRVVTAPGSEPVQEEIPVTPVVEAEPVQEPIPQPEQEPQAEQVWQEPELDDAAPAADTFAPQAAGERVRIHYFEEGSGEPLLLLHTVGQSSYTWRSMFYELSRYYRVIAPDLLGHGYSSRPETFFYSIEEQAAAIERMLDALHIESTHIMAFGMASAYALRLAQTSPQRVGRMILLTPGGLTDEMPSTIRTLDSPILGAIACRFLNVKKVRRVLEDAVFDLTVLSEEVAGEYYKTMADIGGRLAIRESLLNYDEEVVLKDLRAVPHDVLLTLGSEDRWRIPSDLDIYHNGLMNAQFCVIRNTGHLIQEEKPERLLQTVLEFIPAPLDE